MAKTISFSIQKGGSAKTTTSGITAFLLSKEYRVLAIDLDSQGNLTELLTQRDIYDFSDRTIYEALIGGDIKNSIHQVHDNLSILPANDILATFSRYLYTEYTGKNKSLLLNEIISQVEDDYDYIIIDTPPALGDHTINALAASDAVCIMFETSKFCYSALSRFLETVVHIQELVNPKINIAGILRTMIDNRRSDNKALIELVHEEYGDLCFDTIINRQAAVGRLSINGFINNDELNVALSQFKPFIKELIKRV